MKTPQQIRNEVEKEKERINIKEELRKGCGKKITYPNYHLYCGDSNSLRQVFCPKCKAQLSILTEYDKSIKEMIENKMSYVKDSPYYHKSTIIVLKELLSKIGDVQQSKEKRE